MKTFKTPSPDLDTLIPLLIGVWRRFHKLSGPSDKLQTREFRSVVEAVEVLISGLETGDSLQGKDYFTDPNLLGAYLLYHFIIRYQTGLSLLGELPQKPKRVLDICSGPGSFSLAALKHGAEEVIAIDKNSQSLKLAAEVCGRYGFPLTTRTHNVLHFPYPIEGPFDVIIVGYCLEELFREIEKGWCSRQMSWIKQLTSLLAENGHILFVENSLAHSNQRMLSLRDLSVQEGYPILAPCVWKGNCPALALHQPCYAQRDLEKPYLIKEIQRAASINLSSLKMSYLLLRNPKAGWPTFTCEAQSLPFHKTLYRVISPPIDSHAGKRFHLCGCEGKKDVGSHEKEHPKESKAFDFLRRGELISISGARIRGDHLDIVPGTQLKVEAALGKPPPIIETKEED